MSIVVLKLPVVKRKVEERPQKCSACGGETFQRWGRVSKSVKDTRVKKVQVYRYRCCGCKQTFRHYPEGVTQAQQSERLMKLSVIHVVTGIELSKRGDDPGSVWSKFESHEWLAGCAGSREKDPTQVEVESSASGRSRWGMDQW